jgi:hypothetical protein
MEVHESDRRNSRRIQFKNSLRLRVWKSGSAERRVESENLSEHGTLFATDSPMTIGTAVQILLKMPQEITGKPTTEWRYTGHVVVRIAQRKSGGHSIEPTRSIVK